MRHSSRRVALCTWVLSSLSVLALSDATSESDTGTLLISHRGNVEGANRELENRPEYLLEALRLGFDVELDVWLVDGSTWMLGHDEPQYATTLSFLLHPRVWIHAKNGAALRELLRQPLAHVFFHDRDDYTLTSRGIIWAYPDKPVLQDSIAVMYTDPLQVLRNGVARGVCADNVLALRRELEEEKRRAPALVTKAKVVADSPVQLIVFDLDGVLVETRDLHYHALNRALAEVGAEYVISYEDHVVSYNGLSTLQKLAMLSAQRGLDTSLHAQINERKQAHTVELLTDVHESSALVAVFRHFKQLGFPIAVASNCVRASIVLILTKLGVMPFVDTYLSNQDVVKPKPAPDIYLAAARVYGLQPSQLLVIEDSPKGKRAAVLAGVHTVFVDVPEETTVHAIEAGLARAERRTRGGVVNLVVPMAGEGSRFRKAGYTTPKPLIDVRGRHMIEWVIENVRPINKETEFRYVFVVRTAHRVEHNLDQVLVEAVKYAPMAIVQVDDLTDGPACTVLLARQHIARDIDSLLVANSDQWIDWGSGKTVDDYLACAADGCISTFWANDTKWSFARVDETTGFVTEVAEKRVISNAATTGLYFWKSSAAFVKYADQMISKNIRTNGEFYVAPVYNEMIEAGLKIQTWDVGQMWGLGVPADLNYFLEHFPDRSHLADSKCQSGTCPIT